MPAKVRPDELVPVGVWIKVWATDEIQVVGYTYVDRHAGFSAQGWKISGDQLDAGARVIVRLSKPELAWEKLSSEELGRLNLVSPPEWVVRCYGPQPTTGSRWGEWRRHPKLAGRLLPEHPDDLQILVHDGGPSISKHAPEAVWASVVGMDGEIFRARILNEPFHLESIKEGDEVKFIVPHSDRLPLMVRDNYLDERSTWYVNPCGKCGFTELFDAPSELIPVVAPKLIPTQEVTDFTAVCPVCGGAQVVEAASRVTRTTPNQKRPWWKVWN